VVWPLSPTCRSTGRRISDHADEEAEADELTFDEIYFSISHGEIIEDYPDDKPYPSCLIFGMTFSGDPVHSVWAYNLHFAHGRLDSIEF